MSEAYNTLAGLIQLNDKNLADLDITDLLQGAPLLQVMHAQVASNGTQHKYLKEVVASSAAFRAPLAGLAKTNSEDELVTDTLKILDASFDTDVALAKGYKGGVDGWLMRETVRSLRQSFAVVEKQVFYGAAAPGDTGGFVGLSDDPQLNALADEMVVGAGGTTADEQASCYILRHGEDDVSIVTGNDGEIVVEEEPTIIEKVVNPGVDNRVYPAYYVPVLGWIGFQIGGARSACRIANIEMSDLTSATAFTDDSIYAGISKFPSSMQPNVIVMNRDALRLLRQSRTAVNVTGQPAPRPTEVDGIPIVVTDQLVSTEAVVA